MSALFSASASCRHRPAALTDLMVDRGGMVAQQGRFALERLQGQENNCGPEGHKGKAFGHGEASFLAFLCLPPGSRDRSVLALK